MEAAYGAARYREACGLLPEGLRRTALALPAAEQGRAEELRLRIGRPPAVTLPEGETPLVGPAVTGEDLARVTLRQGIYHQIKRMFLACGARVVELRRLSMGGLRLDEGLAPGQCRELTPEELVLLQSREDPWSGS